MSTSVYDKTDKGREEISTRKYHLPSRMRSLLVMVDGKHAIEDLLKKVAGLGLGEQNIRELIDQGFIVEIGAATEAPNTVFPHTEMVAPATPAPAAEVDFLIPVSVNDVDNAKRFQALYNFYTETIKSTVGLRGYGLQLKVERAVSIEDFHELRRPYIEAVLKAKGREIARSLRDRLDQLLYTPGQAVDDKIVPDE